MVGTVSPQAGGPTQVIRMLITNAPAGYTSELTTLDDPNATFLSNLPVRVHAFGSSSRTGRRRTWNSPRCASTKGVC